MMSMNDTNKAIRKSAEQHMLRFAEACDAGQSMPTMAALFAESLADEIGQIIAGRPDEATMMALMETLPGLSNHQTLIVFGQNRELDYVWVRFEDSGRKHLAAWPMRAYNDKRSGVVEVPQPRSHVVTEMSPNG